MVQNTRSIQFKNSIVGQIVHNLDLKDNRSDNKITKNVWQEFWAKNDPNGDFRGKNEIEVCDDGIDVDNAVNIIMTRLFNAFNAFKKRKSVNKIGAEWLKNTINNNIKPEKQGVKEPDKLPETIGRTEPPKIRSVAERLELHDSIPLKKTLPDSQGPKVQEAAKISTEPPQKETAVVTKKSNLYSVDNSYSRLSQSEAAKKAANDPRLEYLGGGAGWSVSEGSFRTDIRYARKNTGKILSFISAVIGENLVITSALGTNGAKNRRSPHMSKANHYCSHHNAENPKLDIKTNGHAKTLRKKLLATGFFSRVEIEWFQPHLDIQIKPEIYAAFENGYDMNNILACAKGNKLNTLLV